MKNILKYGSWITSGVLGAGVITFGGLFVNYFQKSKDYQEIIKNSIGQQEVDLKIKVDALDDTQDTTILYKDVKSLKEVGKIKSLQDLLLTKTDDFKLSAPGQFGSMVEQIKGQSKWIEAIYSKGSWWKISSLDYVKKYPDKQNKGPQGISKGDLSVGVAGVYLTNDFTFTFTQMKV